MNGNAQKEPKGRILARTIHSTLRKYGALDLATLLDRAMISTVGQVRSGMQYSRRHLDTAEMANEIICTTRDLNGTHYYFLAESDKQAEDYELRRKMVALGHIQSVIRLEEKRYEKWPDPQRQAAIKMLGMAHQLLLTAP